MQHLVDVVNSSAVCNVAQVYQGSSIAWRSWDAFLGMHFYRAPKISKMHHCTFDVLQPGKISWKRSFADAEETFSILKTSKEALQSAGLPSILPAGGLSQERQTYLFKEIRQFVAPAFQDELCPPVLPPADAAVAD